MHRPVKEKAAFECKTYFFALTRQKVWWKHLPIIYQKLPSDRNMNFLWPKTGHKSDRDLLPVRWVDFDPGILFCFLPNIGRFKSLNIRQAVKNLAADFHKERPISPEAPVIERTRRKMPTLGQLPHIQMIAAHILSSERHRRFDFGESPERFCDYVWIRIYLSVYAGNC